MTPTVDVRAGLDDTVTRRELWLVAATGLLFGLVLAAVSVTRWRITFSRSYDLGYFDHAAWLVRHGEPLFVTPRGLPLLGDHFGPVFIPMAWLSALIPGRWDLVILQGLALGFTLVPVYLLARRHAGVERKFATLVLVVVALYPTLWNLALSGFHPEVAIVPVVAGAVLAIFERRWGWFAVAAALLLFTKEDYALLVAGLGIVIMLRGARKLGAVVMGVSLAWFVIVVSLIMPALNSGDFSQTQRFSQYGDSTGAIVRYLATHPWDAVVDLFTRDTAGVVLGLLVPLALMPLVGWRVLVAIVPYEWALLLGNEATMHSIRYHYTAAITPVMLCAGVVGAGVLLRRWARPTVAALVVCSVFGFAWWSELGTVWPDRQWRNTTAIEDARREALRVVPSDAPVAVPAELVDAFSQRKFVYQFPQPFDYWAEPKHTGYTRRQRIDAIDWVVHDTNTPWVFPAPPEKYLNEVLPSLGFRPVFSRDGVTVYTRA